jgi:hypothetical protein
MNANSWNYVARRPRHPAGGTAEVEAEIQRPAAGAAPVEARLVDLSRHGVRLQVAVPLAVREPVTVRLCHQPSGIDLALPATVQWQNAEGHREWSLGCLFDRPIDWETLGECFLNEILVDR